MTRTALFVMLLALAAVGCGPERDDTGAITAAGDLTADDLKVGDCFNNTEDEVASVEAVPCDEEHDHEAFALVEHSAGADDEFPGDEAISSQAEELCLPPFEPYVGTDYESSELFITTITPSEETWAEGDRQTICALALEDGAKLDGSQRDSGR